MPLQELDDLALIALVVGSRSVAAALLHRWPLERMHTLERTELRAVHGLGPASAERLLAALEVGLRTMRRQPLPAAAVRDPQAAEALLAPHLRGLPYEELHALYLDRRRRPITRRVLTRGNDAFTIVDPKQIYRPAVALGAGAVVLAHNHPSGDPEPSSQDFEVTRRVAAAGRILGIPLVDHLVIGSTRATSLAARGCLPTWPADGASLAA